MIEYEGDKDRVYSAAGRGETFGEVLTRRLSRRQALKSSIAASAIVFGAASLPDVAAQEASPVAGTAPGFAAVPQSEAAETTVAAGYKVTPFLRWGDPLFPDSPAFDPMTQSAASQAKQFGYNCDYVGFIPLPIGSGASDHGLLVVNHEYTNPEMMFPGYLVPNPELNGGTPEPDSEIPALVPATSQAIIDTELEAHGITVVEIQKGADGVWAVVLDSQYNRRISATTPTVVTGPAAGHELLKTNADATGTSVIGTLNNCAGGITPWGTMLTGEENFQQYFANLDAVAAGPVADNHARYGLAEGASERLWETAYDRFDLAKEPNEPLRFGWIVEIDPFDPASTPKKRTALGR
ncbi:MAG: DUF839 domain-containing protein, partial [Thermomicrobiales bacterium]|nr:DUF839 domain-containing protein [Thermomicrobiales bacterium]